MIIITIGTTIATPSATREFWWCRWWWWHEILWRHTGGCTIIVGISICICWGIGSWRVDFFVNHQFFRRLLEFYNQKWKNASDENQLMVFLYFKKCITISGQRTGEHSNPTRKSRSSYFHFSSHHSHHVCWSPRWKK